MQKKGWLGAGKEDIVSNGDKNFLRNLFNKAAKENKQFYNFYLEPLFYNALNKRPIKAGSFYREYFDAQIPFLNGGLFEPPEDYDWENEFLYLPDELFSTNPTKPEDGEGILDIFDLYNFTVYENDPIDKEVSIDPEMLGKVFENLLEENLRKGTGTYYTPREIVHYMCQECLFNYLKNSLEGVDNKEINNLIHWGELKIQDDGKEIPVEVKLDNKSIELIEKSLKDIKIVDPACGSGAFLVGMLKEIVKARTCLLTLKKDHINVYDIKKQAIQESIHGVDIDPGAVEIAKLRLWLSLIVDFQLHDIEPLPNLDFKIMQGNSLLEDLFIDDERIKLFDSLTIDKNNTAKKVGLFDDVNSSLIKKLKDLHISYYKESSIDKKRNLRDSINDIEHYLVTESVKKELKRLKEQKINIKPHPLLGLGFEEVRKINKISTKEDRILKILDDLQSQGVKPFFIWHLNYMDVFEEKGGFDVVIGNPPYVDSEEMTRNQKEIREIYKNIYRAAQGNWDLFIVFIELGLSLCNKIGTCSLIVKNTLIAAPYSTEIKNIIKEEYSLVSLRDYSNVDVFKQQAVYPVVFVVSSKSTDNCVNFTVMDDEIKIRRSNVIKRQHINEDVYWDKYFFEEEIVNIVLKILNFPKLAIHSDIKVESSSTVAEAYDVKRYLIDSENISEGDKKLINTGTIDRFISLWGVKKTQYIKNQYKHPVIRREDLNKLKQTRIDQSNDKKIIIAGMAESIESFYDQNADYLAGKSTTVIRGKSSANLKYLTAVLNADITTLWYRVYYNSLSMAGGYFNINKIDTIPIPSFISIDKSLKDRLIENVDTIIRLTQINPKVSLKESFQEMNALVNRIFELNNNEVKTLNKFMDHE